MDNRASIALLCATLTATPALAENLAPQSSGQDVRSATEVKESHILVLIRMMVALVLTTTN